MPILASEALIHVNLNHLKITEDNKVMSKWKFAHLQKVTHIQTVEHSFYWFLAFVNVCTEINKPQMSAPVQSFF